MTASSFLLFTSAFGISILLGYLIIGLLWPPHISRRPALALAPVVGAGICSLIFFLFRRPMFTVEFTLLAGLSGLWLLRNRHSFSVSPSLFRSLMASMFAWRSSVLFLFLTAALAFTASGLMMRINLMPHGDWDGFAIWNSHARYLYRDGAAWRTHIQNTFHSDYPLLTPSLTARLWRYAAKKYLKPEDS